jgi:hypothetical protein
MWHAEAGSVVSHKYLCSLFAIQRGPLSIPPLVHAHQCKRRSTTGAVGRRGGSPRIPIANRSTKKAASRRVYDNRN